MSRQAIKEYLREKHVHYDRASKEKKHRVIDEIIETTGLSRKYVINILNGNIVYRARTGRGKSYTGDVAKALKSVWLEAGCLRLADMMNVQQFLDLLAPKHMIEVLVRRHLPARAPLRAPSGFALRANVPCENACAFSSAHFTSSAFSMSSALISESIAKMLRTARALARPFGIGLRPTFPSSFALRRILSVCVFIRRSPLSGTRPRPSGPYATNDIRP